jgi:uncharacterized protein involved in type VI secretion and phage assembly
MSNQDPDKLGRIQVKFVGYQNQPQVWLRMMMPYASKDAGYVFYPEVDDEVVVLRGAGDSIDGMLIIGAMYNGGNVPTYDCADGNNITKRIQSRNGNKITLSDEDDKESIELLTKAGQSVLMTDDSGTTGFAIENSDGTIDLSMDKSGLSLTVANGQPMSITVQGDTTVDCKGNISVKSALETTIEASTNIVCKGSVNANFEAGVTATVNGDAAVNIESSGIVTIKGSLVKIN